MFMWQYMLLTSVSEMEAKQLQLKASEELGQCRSELDRVLQEKQQIEKDIEQYGIDLLSNAAQLQSLQAKLDG